MITSTFGRGLIYAGETSLALTITVEQSGPLRLTVRAGSYTTTGQAQMFDYAPALHDRALHSGLAELVHLRARVCWPVLDDAGRIVAVEESEYRPEDHDALVDSGRAGLLPARTRVRVWASGDERARTHVLMQDHVCDFAVPEAHEMWRGLLVSARANPGTAHVLMQSRHPGSEWPALPERWAEISQIIYEFTLPAAATELPMVPVLAVRPGFPPGTEPEDWREQRGDGGGPVVLPVQVRALGRALQRARAAVLA